MDPTPPAWRALDAPSTTRSDPGPATGPGSAGPATPASPPHGRIVATVAGALACAGLAFVLATSGGSGAEVVVDGGVALASTGSDGGGITSPALSGTATEVVVEIVGAVHRPGVFRLAAGSRVADLVAAAGGYGPRVDTVRAGQELNLAAALRDGEQVRVPSRDDPSAPAGGTTGGDGGVSTGPGTPATGPLDLNTATAEQLDELPGIGPVTVEKILAAREEAPFTSIDELRTRGILGEKTFERIRASIAVP